MLGSILGGALTVAAAWLINWLSIDMPPPPGAVDPITLAVLVRPSDFMWTTGLMVTLLVVSTTAPILRIFRLRVVEALSHI